MPQDDDDMPSTSSQGGKPANAAWWNPDPVLSTTAISVAANFALSHMAVYGIFGSWRLAFGAAMVTIPCSVLECITHAARDYEKWKEISAYREKGLEDKFLPYKCRYDWDTWEARKKMRGEVKNE